MRPHRDSSSTAPRREAPASRPVHGRPRNDEPNAADRTNRTRAYIHPSEVGRIQNGCTLEAMARRRVGRRRGRHRTPEFLSPAATSSIDDRLRQLEAEVEQLKRERAQAVEEPPVNESQVKGIVDDAFKKQKVLAGGQDGFFLQSPGGDFKLKLRGYAQADGRFFADSDGDTGNSTFYMRRVRPIFEGTVYKYFDFKLMPDFGRGQTVLFDAYGDIRYFPYASVRFGKFKPPVSLERQQSATDLTFIERSLIQNLSTNRDVGVQLYGDLLDGALTYQVGIFNGVLDSETGRDLDLTDDKDFAGRVFTVPFKNTDIGPLQNLGFGIAGTYGHQNGESMNTVQYKTAGRSTYFSFNSDAKVVDRGSHYRIDPQLYYSFGPFGLMAEYAVSKQSVSGTVGGATSVDYDAKGWYVQASYVLTGEDSTFKSVTPINNFDPWQGRWGAFEIAGPSIQQPSRRRAAAHQVRQVRHRQGDERGHGLHRRPELVPQQERQAPVQLRADGLRGGPDVQRPLAQPRGRAALAIPDQLLTTGGRHHVAGMGRVTS